MSKWKHSLCDRCWKMINPGREPVRLKPDFVRDRPCCRCGETHRSGIFVRIDPNALPCRGRCED
jgi:hypothetical protein